jgi:hypothetical protein
VALAVVLGVLLNLDTAGYDGPPPLLPKAPAHVRDGANGARRFVYDLTPDDPCLEVEDACARLGSRLERMLCPPAAPLPEGAFAARFTLEFGLLADREDEKFSYTWPADFLRVLVEADVALSVSHYLPKPDEASETNKSDR